MPDPEMHSPENNIPVRRQPEPPSERGDDSPTLVSLRSASFSSSGSELNREAVVEQAVAKELVQEATAPHLKNTPSSTPLNQRTDTSGENASLTLSLLKQLWGHLKDPRGLYASAQALFSCALHRTNGKLLALPEKEDVRARVLTNVSRTYLSALTTGYAMAAAGSQVVHNLFENPLATAASVILIDYAACTATLTGLWIFTNRKFHFDKEKAVSKTPGSSKEVELGKMRRGYFYSMLKVDFAISAIIYGGTSLLSVGLNYLSQSVEQLSSVSKLSGPINATLIYTCFLGIAAKNVVNFAKKMIPEFLSYWEKHKPKFPAKYFKESTEVLATLLQAYSEAPTEGNARALENIMRKTLTGIYHHRNGNKELD